MHLSVEIARQTRQLPKTPDMMNTPKMGLAQYSVSGDWVSAWENNDIHEISIYILYFWFIYYVSIFNYIIIL